jgi:hypothetical protein
VVDTDGVTVGVEVELVELNVLFFEQALLRASREVTATSANGSRKDEDFIVYSRNRHKADRDFQRTPRNAWFYLFPEKPVRPCRKLVLRSGKINYLFK